MLWPERTCILLSSKQCTTAEIVRLYRALVSGHNSHMLSLGVLENCYEHVAIGLKIDELPGFMLIMIVG